MHRLVGLVRLSCPDMKLLKSDVFIWVTSGLVAAVVSIVVAYFVGGWLVYGDVLNPDCIALMTVDCPTNNPCRIEGDDFVVKLTGTGAADVTPLTSPWEHDCSISRLSDGGSVPRRLNRKGRFYVLIGEHVDLQTAAHVFDWLVENYAGKAYAVFGITGMTNSMIGACCKVSQVKEIQDAQFFPVDLSSVNSVRRFCGLICNRIISDVKRVSKGSDDVVLDGTYIWDDYTSGMSGVRSIGVCVIEEPFEFSGGSECPPTNCLFLAERKRISDEKQIDTVVGVLYGLVMPSFKPGQRECVWEHPTGMAPRIWQVYFDEMGKPLFSTCWSSSGKLMFTMGDAYVSDGNGRYEFQGMWRGGSCTVPEFKEEFPFLFSW